MFEEIAEGRYEVCISDLVLAEINRTKDEEKKEKMLRLIQRFQPKELSRSEEAYLLAEKYVGAGIIPKRFEADAIHIAYAVVNDLDVLISWNMSHIVRLKTRWGVNSIKEKKATRRLNL